MAAGFRLLRRRRNFENVNRGAGEALSSVGETRGRSAKKIARINHLNKAENHYERENNMTNILKTFMQDDQGQDLIEYTLLLAFVALASAAVFIGAGTSITGIWTAANTRLANANALAAS